MTDQDIKLGLLYPYTGNASSLFLPFRSGVAARLGAANAAGGINGRQVTYTWRDDESDAATNLAAARALVDDDQVFGILESTSVAAGSAAFLHQQGVPVTGTSLDDSWTVYPNMFSYSNLIARARSVTTWGDFVAAHGGHTALIAVAQFSATSLAFADELTESLQAAGIHVVGRLDVTAPLDFTGVGRAVRDSGADVLVGAVTAATFGQVVAAAHVAGANLPVILSPTGYDQSILRVFGAVLAGVYVFVDYEPFEVNPPAHQAFLDAMARYSPEEQPASQQAALAGWISTDMFLRGLAAAGTCPSRQSFITGLRAVTNYTAGGLLPSPLNLSTNFGAIDRCYNFLQVTPDGKAFTPIPPLPRCGSPLG